MTSLKKKKKRQAKYIKKYSIHFMTSLTEKDFMTFYDILKRKTTY